jgi:hypothetical protein
VPVAFDQRRPNVLPSMHVPHGHRFASRPARLPMANTEIDIASKVYEDYGCLQDAPDVAAS